MHIAIDDTYSSNVQINSAYVTSERRTNVAVCFPDDDVSHIRTQLFECLNEFSQILGTKPDEFHFVEIINRRGLWSNLTKEQANRVVEFFVWIYNQYRWPVLIQTVDDRTFADHGIELGTDLHGLNPSKREDQSLFLLLLRLRMKFKEEKTITLILDEGRSEPGSSFGSKFFPEWGTNFKGYFESSAKEPLLQLADFVAYVINKSTNLATKVNRTNHENQLIDIIGHLKLNSTDVRTAELPITFGHQQFDAIHAADRQSKGLDPQICTPGATTPE